MSSTVYPSAYQYLDQKYRDFYFQLSQECSWLQKDFNDREGSKLNQSIQNKMKESFQHLKEAQVSKATATLLETAPLVKKKISPIIHLMALTHLTQLFILLSACTMPVTMIADLISVIAQATLGLYHKQPLNDIKLILKAKLIISPVQHIAIFVVFHLLNLLLLRAVIKTSSGKVIPAVIFHYTYLYVLASPLFLFTSIRKTVSIATVLIQGNAEFFYYISTTFSKECSTQLCDSQYSIFLERDPLNDCQLFNLMFTLNKKKDFKKWEAYAKENSKHLKKVPPTTPFNQFLNRFVDQKKPEELLELESDYSEEQLKAAFKKWSLILHPDKNREYQEVSGILFHALNEARTYL